MLAGARGSADEVWGEGVTKRACEGDDRSAAVPGIEASRLDDESGMPFDGAQLRGRVLDRCAGEARVEHDRFDVDGEVDTAVDVGLDVVVEIVVSGGIRSVIAAAVIAASALRVSRARRCR